MCENVKHTDDDQVQKLEVIPLKKFVVLFNRCWKYAVSSSNGSIFYDVFAGDHAEIAFYSSVEYYFLKVSNI